MNRTRGAQRFPKSRRLRKRQEFLAVQRRGRRIHLGDMLILHLGRVGKSRLGVTVSRKVGNAVQRNRVKRLIREVWRLNRRLVPEGYDLVFVAKRSARTASFASLLSQLKELSRRLQRVHDDG